jgi:maltose alpha-D-glucosyltransferase/alpha-amylase
MKFLPDSPNKEGGLLDNIQRCGSRTPMQWSKERNAGFSTAPAEKLYLPIDPSDSRPDAATQENDPGSLLNFTRALLKLRREHPALANTADFQTLYAAENQYPFVYLRVAEAERIIVAINPAARACAADLGERIELGSLRPLLTERTVLHNRRLEMAPVSFGIFAVE